MKEKTNKVKAEQVRVWAPITEYGGGWSHGKSPMRGPRGGMAVSDKEEVSLQERLEINAIHAMSGICFRFVLQEKKK